MNVNSKIELNQDKINELLNNNMNDLVEKKELSMLFSEELSALKRKNNAIVTDKTLERICSCGDYMQLLANEDFSKKKVMKVNFCGYRFCPRCSYLGSRRMAVKLFTCAQYIREKLGYELIFLTLTVPNCKGSELRETISLMNKGVSRLRKRVEWLDAIRGYFRKEETTYNEEENTYHPHFHLMLIVDKDYFRTKKYIKQEQWLSIWKDCMRNDKIEVLDVRKIGDNYKDVLELAKYETKASDMKTPEVMETIISQLSRTKQFQTGGLMQDIFKMYDRKELLEYMSTIVEVIQYTWLVLCKWSYNSLSYAYNVERYFGQYDNAELDDFTEL